MKLSRMVGALFFCLHLGLAQASNYVTERAWVEDPTNSMTLAQVKKSPETLITGKLFSQGFSQSAYWIRLHIDPAAMADRPSNDKLVIRIRPPYQDQIWLFDPLAESDKARITGDYFDWEQDEYHSINLNFVVPLGVTPRDIWLKLKTNQSTLTSIEVLTEDEVRRIDRHQEVSMMFYLSVLFVCLGWGILARINQRDGLVSLYILREVMALLYAFAMTGYIRVFCSGWLPTAWLDLLMNLIVFVFVAVAILFDSRLIGEFKPNRWLARSFLSLALFCPIEIGLALTGHMAEAIRISGIVVVAGVFLALACAISTRAWKEKKEAPADEQPVYPKTFLVGTYVFILAAVMLNRLPVMGMINAEENFFYFNLIYPLVTSVTLVGLVQIRLYRLAKRQQEAQYRLELAEREARNERMQRIEQSNFLKMLAHEMKTPLSVVRLSTGVKEVTPQISKRVDRAVTDMNNIIERLLQVEQLNDGQFVLQKSRFNLFALIATLVDRTDVAERWIIDCDTELTIESDERFVQTILANLIDNAVKYGATNQPLRLKVEEIGNQLKIKVQSGVGNAGAPDREKVFDKYYRAPGAHERTGSGLGLFFTQKLTELMGGRVTMDSQGDQVCFDVVLPIAGG